MGNVASEATTYAPVSPEVRLAALRGLQRFLDIVIEQADWLLKYTQPGSTHHEAMRIQKAIWQDEQKLLTKMTDEIRQEFRDRAT